MNTGRREAAERLRDLRDERDRLRAEVERLRTERGDAEARAANMQQAAAANAADLRTERDRVAVLTAERDMLQHDAASAAVSRIAAWFAFRGITWDRIDDKVRDALDRGEAAEARVAVLTEANEAATNVLRAIADRAEGALTEPEVGYRAVGLDAALAFALAAARAVLGGTERCPSCGSNDRKVRVSPASAAFAEYCDAVPGPAHTPSPQCDDAWHAGGTETP